MIDLESVGDPSLVYVIVRSSGPSYGRAGSNTYTRDHNVALWMSTHLPYPVIACSEDELISIMEGEQDTSGIEVVRALPRGAHAAPLAVSSADLMSGPLRSYIKRSVVTMSVTERDSWASFRGMKASNMFPKLVLNHVHEGPIVRIAKSSIKDAEQYDVDLPRPGCISALTFVEREQPNKETLVRVGVSAMLDPTNGTVEMKSQHRYVYDKAQLLDNLASLFTGGGDDPYVCTELDVVSVHLAPGHIMRSDVMMYLVMSCENLSCFSLCESGIYATEASCRLSLALGGGDKKCTVRLRNMCMSSLTTSKKLQIRYGTPCISMSVSSIKDYRDMCEAREHLRTLVETYVSMQADVASSLDAIVVFDPYLTSVKEPRHTPIKAYRSDIPELFVQRYTRESPQIPMIIPDDEVDHYRALGRSVMRYPKDGPYARYYMAQEGWYVGLKVNRLHNSGTFPYLVTCYRTDHSIRPSTHTYSYLSGAERRTKGNDASYITKVKRLDPWRRGLVPEYVSNLLDSRGKRLVSRIGMPRHPREFLTSMARPQALSFDGFHVAKQELWHMSVDEIMLQWNALCSYDAMFDMYRILEHIIEADVIVVEEDAGDIVVHIQDCPMPYIWRHSYDRALIIVHARINEYEMTYEIISCGPSGPYVRKGDPLYDEVIGAKYRATWYDTRAGYDAARGSHAVDEETCHALTPVMDVHDVELRAEDIGVQYIDDKGKVVLVTYKDGREAECLARPVNGPLWTLVSGSPSVIGSYISNISLVDANAASGLYDGSEVYRVPKHPCITVRDKDVGGCVTLVGQQSYDTWRDD